jgi:UDP-N-acetylglucosamine--N-acetylmuramyl-(pentapeptide) pyrophosphoryl-undecaprenol N-acetylglucosamine transferase
MKIPGSLLESYRIIRSFRPDVVAGVGGYASGPAVLAARMMGIKTVIAEQNAVPGLTNRILGHFVHRVFVTFTDSRRYFPEGKTAVTGNPVRISFLKEAKAAAIVDIKLRFMNTKLRFHELPLHNRPFTILIFGGSQGARAINQKVMESLDSLLTLRGDIHFIHQTGESDQQSVEQEYRKRGFSAEVYPFIIDMAETYSRADLLLCRAGATSLAEITAVGKASILIPLPSAAGDHQTKNALLMEKAGASVMIPEKSLDGPKLAQEIERLYRKRETIETMEAASASLGRKDAAATIVDMILTLR